VDTRTSWATELIFVMILDCKPILKYSSNDLNVFEKVIDHPEERARTADLYPAKIEHTKIF